MASDPISLSHPESDGRATPAPDTSSESQPLSPDREIELEAVPAVDIPDFNIEEDPAEDLVSSLGSADIGPQSMTPVCSPASQDYKLQQQQPEDLAGAPPTDGGFHEDFRRKGPKVTPIEPRVKQECTERKSSTLNSTRDGVLSRGVPEKGPLLCPTCGRMFKDKSGLKSHMRIHAGVKPFQCKVCEKAFTQSSQLCNHSRIHSEEKPFCCPTCGKTFRVKQSLQFHIRTHTKEKPYVCDLCPKAFSVRCNLVKHLRIHRGERPHTCETCSKAFYTTTALKAHVRRVHTRERPYSCRVCGKGFADSQYLKRHTRIHGNALRLHQ